MLFATIFKIINSNAKLINCQVCYLPWDQQKSNMLLLCCFAALLLLPSDCLQTQFNGKLIKRNEI